MKAARPDSIIEVTFSWDAPASTDADAQAAVAEAISSSAAWFARPFSVLIARVSPLALTAAVASSIAA